MIITGADLKNARKAARMSQGKLADQAGVSRDKSEGFGI